MSKDSNWIERKAAVEKSLKINAPQVWAAVRSAIQNACHSFRENYAAEREVKLTDKLENGSRLVVSMFDGATQSTANVIVSFNPDIPAIEWADYQGHKEAAISANETTAFLVEENGTHIRPDELSQRILEPLLFGKQ